ncbi:hypothetical protein MTO96_005903 [Rhipicephalus appendiculatus]
MRPAERDASQETARTEWSSAYSGAGVTAGTASLATTDAYVATAAQSLHSAQNSAQMTAGGHSGRLCDSASTQVNSKGRDHTTGQAVAPSPSSTGYHSPLSRHLATPAGPLNKPAPGTAKPAKKLAGSFADVVTFKCAVPVTTASPLLRGGHSYRALDRVSKFGNDYTTRPQGGRAAVLLSGRGQPPGEVRAREHAALRRLRELLELAAGLAETTGLKPDMTAGEVLNYFLHVSLKFHTESLLVVEKPGRDLPSLRLMPYDIRLNKSQLELFGIALDAVVDRFNAEFNTSVSSADVIALDSKLRLEYSPESAFEKFRIDQIGELIPSYTSQRWVKDLASFGWSDVANVIELYVRDHVQVTAIFNTLLDKENGPAVFGYLLAYTVACAYSGFDTRWELQLPSSVSSACLRNSLEKFHNTWQLTYARMFASPERTALVNATFRFVLEAVIADVQNSSLSALEKLQAVNVLSGVTIVPPPREVVIPGASNALLPTSEDFGLAYYSGLEHEFSLTKGLTLLGMPHGIDQHRPATMFDLRVFPSAVFYPYMDFDNPTSSAAVSNMPVMGMSFAQLLWAAVVKSLRGSSGSSRAFSELHECASFRNDDKGAEDNSNTSVSTGTDDSGSGGQRPFDIVPLLALKSVLRTMGVSKAGWHERRLSWSDWNLSHAQFFYDRYVFFTCFFGEKREPRLIMEDVNAVLAYVRDFAKAFACSGSSAMMKKRPCFV